MTGPGYSQELADALHALRVRFELDSVQAVRGVDNGDRGALIVTAWRGQLTTLERSCLAPPRPWGKP